MGAWWTEEETEKLISLYPTHTWSQLTQVFPNHDRKSIDHKITNLRKRHNKHFKRLGKGIFEIPHTKLIDGFATDFEKGFIVGLIEGEGSLTASKPTKVPCAHPLINIANTKIELLKKAQSIIGGRIGFQKPRGKFTKQGVWYLKITRFRHVYETLIRLLPYFITKRRQAELIIKLCEHRFTLPQKITPQDTSIALEIVNEIHKTNRRKKIGRKV